MDEFEVCASHLLRAELQFPMTRIIAVIELQT